MAESGERKDPYNVARFTVELEGKAIGIHRVSGLRRTTEVLLVREGGESHGSRPSPGLTKNKPILLERAKTDDATFEDWAALVGGRQGGEKPFRRPVRIVLLDESGKPGLAYDVSGCWPSKYVAFVALNANQNHVVVERLLLEHEGWVQDRKANPGPAPQPQ
jgi:phage tail-like protein